MTQRPIDADAFNAFEAAGWDEVSDVYHRFFGPITSRVIDPLLDAAHVGSATRLLDVASGPGYVAARAAERGAAVIGVDVAPAMVAMASRLHAGIEFREGDAERLPFDDASFDAVVANFVVLHLGRPERAATEFARVLVPGGRVALSMWDQPERMRLMGVILDAIADAGAETPEDIPVGPPFFRFSDDAEFARLLADAGLREVEVQPLAFTHRLSNTDELWEGFVGGTARTRWLILKQSDEVRGRIRAALDARVAEYQREGGLEIPVAVKIASGRKA